MATLADSFLADFESSDEEEEQEEEIQDMGGEVGGDVLNNAIPDVQVCVLSRQRAEIGKGWRRTAVASAERDRESEPRSVVAEIAGLCTA